MRLCLSLLLCSLMWMGCGESGDDAPVDAASDASDNDVKRGKPNVLSFSDASARIGAEPMSVLGVAMVDFDGDGWLDLTLAERSGVRLFRGTGDGFFTAHSAGLAGSDNAAAVVWVDVDGDADLDLFVSTRIGADQLWLNMGDGELKDVSAESGFGTHSFGQGASFGDLDGDGDLDLYLCQGVSAGATGEVPDRGDGSKGNPNRVYRNDGVGHFEDVTAEWGLAGVSTGESFMALLYDIDGDTDLDVLVVHDHVPDQVFLNPGDGTAFLDGTSSYLPNGDTSIMGMDLTDLDQDGSLDVYGTQAGRDLIYMPQPDGKFANSYPQLIGNGVDQSALLVGWGVAFLDADNDGDADILTTASYPDASSDASQPWSAGRLVLLENELSDDGPTLTDKSDDAGEAFQRTLNGWGIAVGDVDRDGDLDALIGVDSDISDSVVPPGDDPHIAPILLLNDLPQSSSLSISLRLQQPDSPNPFAVGAVVSVETADTRAMRVLLAGVSYLSQHSYALHFGLKSHQRAEVVRVKWPDGVTQLWVGLPAGEHKLVRSTTGNCCLPNGECTTLGEAECRARMVGSLDVQELCDLACTKLESCELLARADAKTKAECNSGCLIEPPDEGVLQCYAYAPCDDLGPCIDREDQERDNNGGDSNSAP